MVSSGTDSRLTLQQFQDEVTVWSSANFGDDGESVDPLLGIAEEVGELCHAYLKRKQGIRGTADQHRAAIVDAVGDICIYLADFCRREGLFLDEIIERTWAQVKTRNWKENPVDGTTTTEPN